MEQPVSPLSIRNAGNSSSQTCAGVYINTYVYTHTHGSNIMLWKDFSGTFESTSKLASNLVTMSCPEAYAEALEEQFIWAILTIPS